MSAEPKPASGEWMASTVEIMFMANPKNAHYAIAAAHNAAIAAAWRKGHADAQAPALERIDELHKQLAAEREKHKTLAHAFESERELRKRYEDENKTFRAAQKACEDCDGPTMAEVQQMREQLAAEREKVQTLMLLLKSAGEPNWIRAEDNPGFNRYE